MTGGIHCRYLWKDLEGSGLKANKTIGHMISITITTAVILHVIIPGQHKWMEVGNLRLNHSRTKLKWSMEPLNWWKSADWLMNSAFFPTENNVHVLILIGFIQHYSLLLSRLAALMACDFEWVNVSFNSAFFRSGVLTVLFDSYMAGATWNCCCPGACLFSCNLTPTLSSIMTRIFHMLLQ